VSDLRAVVVTVSDRCFAGSVEDRSGPLAVSLLAELGVLVQADLVVPDETLAIATAVSSAVARGVDLVLTTGGTGLAPRDVTPEAVSPLLDRTVPGIAELLRSVARERVPTSVLSRGVVGVIGRTLVVTLPGSTGGVRDGIEVLGPLLVHISDQLAGGDHR
jgi:molybdenum cofactor synthesis domain-containing protein